MQDKTFELLEKMYVQFTNKIDNLSREFTEFRKETKEDIQALKNQVTSLEFNLKKDISALYDGYIQNTQQLDRIEKEVSRYEDIIIKKVK